MFRARIFRGNSGPAQNVASRLDETQNFASRLDETTGFDRHVPNLREGCLRQPAPAAATASVWTGILYHIDVRTPHARGMFGEIQTYNLASLSHHSKRRELPASHANFAGWNCQLNGPGDCISPLMPLA